MPEVIPVTNDGNRKVSVAPDGETFYWFRTYFSEGQINTWFLDIADSQGNPLVSGIPIVVGAPNLLKGYGDKFPQDAQLIAVNIESDEQDPAALGNGLYLMWFNEGETNPYAIGDPMIDISASDYTFQESTVGDHDTLDNRFIPNQHNVGAIQGLSQELANKATVEQLNQKIGDAPADGKPYNRMNNGWVEATSSSGGGGDGFFGYDGTAQGVYLRQYADSSGEEGGGGTDDHTQLNNRDAADQHPQSAITGLTADLAGKAGRDELAAGLGEKADLTHAAQHATSGLDPIAPLSIGAMPAAPNDGREYHAKGSAWEPVDLGSVGLPEGGNVGDVVVNTAPGTGAWAAPRADVGVFGLAAVDGTTITSSGGVLSVVGGGSGEPGTSDHAQLTNRDAASQHPGTSITITGDSSATNAQTAIAFLRTSVASKADAAETEQALSQKADASALSNYATVTALGNGLSAKADAEATTTALAAKAPLVSPALTGMPTVNGSAFTDMAFFPAPPSDGNSYVAKDGGWTAATFGVGAIVGEFRLLPNRITELPGGWYYPSGDYYEQNSPVGQALLSFSTNYKSDWGITTSGTTIRLYNPDMFFATDGDGNTVGRFLRFADGTIRHPGSVQGDAIRNITGSSNSSATPSTQSPTIQIGSSTQFTGAFKNNGIGTPNYVWSANAYTGASLAVFPDFDASRDVPTAAENRPFNVALTPAFYLGV